MVLRALGTEHKAVLIALFCGFMCVISLTNPVFHLCAVMYLLDFILQGFLEVFKSAVRCYWFIFEHLFTAVILLNYMPMFH